MLAAAPTVARSSLSPSSSFSSLSSFSSSTTLKKAKKSLLLRCNSNGNCCCLAKTKSMTWPCVLAHVVFLLLAGVTLGGEHAGPATTATPTTTTTPSPESSSSMTAKVPWYGWLARGGAQDGNETWTMLPLQTSGGSTKAKATTTTTTTTSGRQQASPAQPQPPPPQRAKWISSKVTAAELYEAYQEVKTEYMQKAFSTSRPWKVLKETKDGVQIALLEHEHDASCPYVRMRAVMPGSVEEVWNYLRVSNWAETMPQVDPFYEGHEVLGDYSLGGKRVDMTIVRKRTKRVVTFGKRDFMFISVCDAPTPDGVWVSGTVSIKGPALFGRRPGYIRAFQDSIAFYEPLSPQETCLTIVVRIDLNDAEGEGGNVPMWFYVKTVGQSGVLTMATMKRELLKVRNEHAVVQLAQPEEKPHATNTRAANDDEATPPCPKETVAEEEKKSPPLACQGGGGRRRWFQHNKDDTRLPLLPWMSVFSKSSLPLYPHYVATTTSKRRKTLCEQGRDNGDDGNPHKGHP